MRSGLRRRRGLPRCRACRPSPSAVPGPRAPTARTATGTSPCTTGARSLPDDLRAVGWPGTVFEIGGWGGGVFNGGAWLEVDGRKVDVHYRDLEDVEYRLREARAGRFGIERLHVPPGWRSHLHRPGRNRRQPGAGRGPACRAEPAATRTRCGRRPRAAGGAARRPRSGYGRSAYAERGRIPRPPARSRWPRARPRTPCGSGRPVGDQREDPAGPGRPARPWTRSWPA